MTGTAAADAALGADGHSIQVFSSPSDAPRVRVRTDLASAAVSAAVLAFVVLVAGEGASFDRTTLDFVGSLPDWLVWLGRATYALGIAYALGLLLGVGIFARGRLELLRDLLLAGLLSAVITLALTAFIDNRWPEFAFFEVDNVAETFPAFFVAIATAIQAAASPYLTTPMRRIGWSLILVTAIASVFGAVTTVTDMIGALLVGLLSAALVRYAFGTSAGLPSTNRVRRGLSDLNVSIDDLWYTDDATADMLFGTATDGAPLAVTLLGRDSWNSRRMTRWWRFAWYQDDGSQYGSDRRQEIEHHALAVMLAERAGASVASVIAVGMSEVDDALLVSDRPAGRVLADFVANGDPVDDSALDAVWAQLRHLHEAVISHGSLGADSIWITPDDEPFLVRFGDASIRATTQQLHEDVAALLVTTTLVVGADRAIAAARRALGDDELTAMLPVLQTASLGASLRRQAKHAKLKISTLRDQLTEALGVDAPELEKLQRVSIGNIVMVGFVGFAVYTIISGLADVGFATIWDTLSDARWGLVLLGLVLAGSTNMTDAVSVSAASPKPVPIGVTTVEQFAIGFVNLAVPSAAGRMATNARYFQKFGINAVTSTTTGVITGLVGFCAQALLIVLALIVGEGGVDLSGLQTDGGVLRLIGMIAVIVVVVLVVVMLVPRWRHWALALAKKTLGQVGEALQSIRDPKSAALTFGGALSTEILYGAGLAMCVLAVGGSVSLGEAILINVLVSLFAGMMPIPGGVGVSEAGLTAGLVAVGVSSEVAVSAVLVYRLVSYYLPPIWGWFCLRWLTRHDYL